MGGFGVSYGVERGRLGVKLECFFFFFFSVEGWISGRVRVRVTVRRVGKEGRSVGIRERWKRGME